MIGPPSHSFLSAVVFVPLLFDFVIPTPEANLWDWRFAPESIIVYLFVVNAKESAANGAIGCCVVDE